MAKVYERLLSTNILREKSRDSFDPHRVILKRSFVLSSKHENQNVATIGTLLDQFMLSCK